VPESNRALKFIIIPIIQTTTNKKEVWKAIKRPLGWGKLRIKEL
jgi:hypothetical protein